MGDDGEYVFPDPEVLRAYVEEMAARAQQSRWEVGARSLYTGASSG